MGRKRKNTLNNFAEIKKRLNLARNTTKVLEEYSDYLQDEGFTVTFGSEHNTPAMEPIKLRTSDHPEGLSEKLRKTNFRGACKVVAHQAGLDSIDAGEEIIMETLNK